MNRWIVAFTTLQIGCAELSRITPEDRCGDQIVEPEHDEDCESSAPMGFTCGSACRFICEEMDCPGGWVCGSDKICRVPRGNFISMPLDDEVPRNAAAADLDGDALEDLVILTLDDVEVRYGDRAGEFAETQTYLVDDPFGDLETGNFDGDDFDDLGIEQRAGPVFIRGRKDRVLEQVARPAFALTYGAGPLGAAQLRFISARIDPITGLRHTVLLKKGDRTVRLEAPFLPGTPPLLWEDEGALPFEIAVGAIDGSTIAADTIALGLEGSRNVALIEIRCCMDPSCGMPGCEVTIAGNVATSSEIQAGTYLADADDDGALDLIVQTATTSAFEIAFGDGAGGFCAERSSPCPAESIGKTAPFAMTLDGAVIGVGPSFIGELGFTGHADIAFEDDGQRLLYFGTRLRSAPGRFQLEVTEGIIPVGTAGWIQIEKGDFNRDGLPDMAAIRSETDTVDILLGTGTVLFNPFAIPFEEAVDRIAVGDFDGDLYHDVVAYDQTGALSVIFGSPQGPLPPMVMIQSRPVIDLIPVHAISASGIDLISDLLVVSRSTTPDTYGVTLLFGSSRRNMLAPLSFLIDGMAQQQAVLDAVIGRFTPDDAEDVLIATVDFGGAPERSGVRVWIAKGSTDNSALVEQLELADTCPLRSRTILEAPPAVGNFDTDEEDEVMLLASEPEESIWVGDIDAEGKLDCWRLDSLESAISPFAELVAIDIDFAGLSEIAIYEQLETKLARSFDGRTWTVTTLAHFRGEPPLFLTPIPGSAPGKDLAFVATSSVWVGTLEGDAVTGTEYGLYPSFTGFREREAGDGEIESGIIFYDRGGLLVIDAKGDAIPDLVVLGHRLLLQAECVPSDAECERPGVAR